jgi:hypothetical protein
VAVLTALLVKRNGVFVPVGGATWTRPADWPALPAVVATDQIFRGLYAIFDHGSNFATIRCTGAYTVDWGDGSAPVNVASNTTAQYNYSYAASGLGAVTSRGYKTAIVTVTPQAGQTLSNIDIIQKHTQSGLINGHSSKWLDIRLAMNNVGTVTANSINWPARLLEQFEWVGGSSVQTNFAGFLRESSSLQSLPLFNTAAGTSFSEFLTNCLSIRTIPLFNTAASTGFAGFMSGCVNLETIPLINTAASANFAFFLAGCSSLRSIPLIITAAGTNFSNFLNGATSLELLPLLNVAAGLDFGNFLFSCTSLQLLPALNFAAGTNFNNAFFNTSSLSRIQATFPANQNIPLGSKSLGPAARNEIYTNLPTASGSPRTITVTGNWDIAGDDPSIATAKGWTVTK